MTGEEAIAGIVDIDALAAATLAGDSFIVRLGVPITKEIAGGIIGGSPPNDDFVVDHPIYPVNGKSIAPVAADITAYTRLTASPYTETEAAVTALATGTDGNGYVVYNTLQLTTPPSSDTDDAVLVSYHAENDLYVQQSLKFNEDVDEKEISRLGSTTKYTSIAGIATSLEVECILSDLKPILLTYEEDADQAGVESGYVRYSRRTTPQTIYAYVPIYSASEGDDPMNREELGRIILENVKIPPVLPEVSAGEDATVTLTLNVGDDPKILVKTGS